MKRKSIKAENFDLKFDQGEDISKYLDISKAIRPSQNQKRVNVDFPVWMINSLDKEARKLGVTRQSIIKIWIAEKLKESSFQGE
jgi:hypothetical protein